MPELGHEELLLLPYLRALELLGGRDVHLNVVTPPYPALGIGNLHVVRVRHEGESIVLETSYDDYERLP
ncbi:MAG TPA: hypothetical protein VEJ41_10630 [Candidatus Acidoferrales bacterium]|nr:hypothetical protein [Candidatus Acidoferrales bacterium]